MALYKLYVLIHWNASNTHDVDTIAWPVALRHVVAEMRAIVTDDLPTWKLAYVFADNLSIAKRWPSVVFALCHEFFPGASAGRDEYRLPRSSVIKDDFLSGPSR